MSIRHLGDAAFNDTTPRERLDCPQCSWFAYSEGRLAAHLLAVHPAPVERRSPVLRRFAEAAAAGQGVSTEAALARRRVA